MEGPGRRVRRGAEEENAGGVVGVAGREEGGEFLGDALEVEVGGEEEEEEELAEEEEDEEGEPIPLSVVNRVLALKDLQASKEAVDALYRQERRELERRYRERFALLFEKRRQIVAGELDVHVQIEGEEDVDDGEAERIARAETGEGPLQGDTGATRHEHGRGVDRASAEEEEAPLGIPGFWVTAMVNHPSLAAIIEEDDVDCLRYLQDIVCVEQDDLSGYRVDFHFLQPNPYFSNAVLRKEYEIDSMLADGTPVSATTAEGDPGEDGFASPGIGSRQNGSRAAAPAPSTEVTAAAAAAAAAGADRPSVGIELGSTVFGGMGAAVGGGGERLLTNVQSTEIAWHPNQNLCVKRVRTRRRRRKGSAREDETGAGGAPAPPGSPPEAATTTTSKLVPRDSFFNFFAPPRMELLGSDALDEAEREEYENLLHVDFAVAEVFRSHLVPHGVLWYTGEALEGTLEDDDNSDSQRLPVPTSAGGPEDDSDTELRVNDRPIGSERAHVRRGRRAESPTSPESPRVRQATYRNGARRHRYEGGATSIRPGQEASLSDPAASPSALWTAHASHGEGGTIGDGSAGHVASTRHRRGHNNTKSSHAANGGPEQTQERMRPPPARVPDASPLLGAPAAASTVPNTLASDLSRMRLDSAGLPAPIPDEGMGDSQRRERRARRHRRTGGADGSSEDGATSNRAPRNNTASPTSGSSSSSAEARRRARKHEKKLRRQQQKEQKLLEQQQQQQQQFYQHHHPHAHAHVAAAPGLVLGADMLPPPPTAAVSSSASSSASSGGELDPAGLPHGANAQECKPS